MNYNPNSYYQQALIKDFQKKLGVKAGFKAARKAIYNIGNFSFGSKIINKKITKRLKETGYDMSFV